MRIRRNGALLVAGGLLLALPAAAQQEQAAQPPGDEFRRQMAAVLEEAPVLLADKGYLEIAQTDIAVTLRELGAAGHTADGLAEMKRRISRAAHALSPSVVPEGPGTGIGAVEALDRVIRHLQAAALAEPVREDVELAATPAIVATRTARERVQEAAALAPAVAAAETPERVREVAARMTRLLSTALSGVDLNEDGDVTWNLGEGGLYHTHVYANMMALGSGLAMMPEADQTPSQ